MRAWRRNMKCCSNFSTCVFSCVYTYMCAVYIFIKGEWDLLFITCHSIIQHLYLYKFICRNTDIHICVSIHIYIFIFVHVYLWGEWDSRFIFKCKYIFKWDPDPVFPYNYSFKEEMGLAIHMSVYSHGEWDSERMAHRDLALICVYICIHGCTDVYTCICEYQ